MEIYNNIYVGLMISKIKQENTYPNIIRHHWHMMPRWPLALAKPPTHSELRRQGCRR